MHFRASQKTRYEEAHRISTFSNFCKLATEAKKLTSTRVDEIGLGIENTLTQKQKEKLENFEKNILNALSFLSENSQNNDEHNISIEIAFKIEERRFQFNLRIVDLLLTREEGTLKSYLTTTLTWVVTEGYFAFSKLKFNRFCPYCCLCVYDGLLHQCPPIMDRLANLIFSTCTFTHCASGGFHIKNLEVEWMIFLSFLKSEGKSSTFTAT